MVASSQVRCIVMAIPVDTEVTVRRTTPKPSELLPWADPYIAQLVEKLQDEVREERRRASLGCRNVFSAPGSCGPADSCRVDDQLVDDLEVPWTDVLTDDELPGDERRPEFNDDCGDLPRAR